MIALFYRDLAFIRKHDKCNLARLVEFKLSSPAKWVDDSTHCVVYTVIEPPVQANAISDEYCLQISFGAIGQFSTSSALVCQ